MSQNRVAILYEHREDGVFICHVFYDFPEGAKWAYERNGIVTYTTPCFRGGLRPSELRRIQRFQGFIPTVYHGQAND